MRRIKWLLRTLLLLLGFLAGVSALQAQESYKHTWFSVDGGATTLRAGGYTLTGVVGQAETGQLNAGGYTLTGGMLALPAPTKETPGETPDASLFLPRLDR